MDFQCHQIEKLIYQKSKCLGKHLTQRNWKISTVESCTGGFLAKCITDVPGSSVYFTAGLVTYSLQSKTQYLHLDAKLIEKYGVVSIEIAKQMAKNMQYQNGSNIALSTTGFASSPAPSVAKLGLVCFGMLVEGQIMGFSKCFKDNRLEIRTQSVQFILDTLLSMMK